MAGVTPSAMPLARCQHGIVTRVVVVLDLGYCFFLNLLHFLLGVVE